MDGDFKKVATIENAACGKIPILILMEIAKRKNWEAKLIHYSNSGDVSQSKSSVVGYSLIAFYESSKMKQTEQISIDTGKKLVTLARLAIMSNLVADNKKYAKEKASLISELEQNDKLNKKSGVFVTLKINGELRGCIGTILGYDTILNSVAKNALSAAFSDPRFVPLTLEELKKTEVEVSVLTEPKEFKYKNSDDLISKLEKDKFGLIIQKGGKSATFLPQVWEELSKPEDFLSHLCSKAGLYPDAWRKDELQIFSYKVQSF